MKISCNNMITYLYIKQFLLWLFKCFLKKIWYWENTGLSLILSVSVCLYLCVFVSLALRSPWVVCAANVYDLNQANPTGLFRRIGNDLQDAAAEPKTRGGNQWKSRGSAWSHSLTRPLHLSPSGFVPSSVSASLPVCVFRLPSGCSRDRRLYLTNSLSFDDFDSPWSHSVSPFFSISPQEKQENPYKLGLFFVSRSCAKASGHVVDSSL